MTQLDLVLLDKLVMTFVNWLHRPLNLLWA
jgi:hypothetical protein